MQSRDLPGRKTGRRTRYAFRSLFFVVLATTGVFAGTALPSSTTRTQPEQGTAIMGKQALALERADLSTLAGIKRYLRATGIDPRSVVIQRGAKNYAGPNCPGAGWNCTNAGNVVQVGAQNTHECVGGTKTPATPAGFQECVVVQSEGSNVAKCVQKSKNVPFIRQRCSIMQTGAYNEATIVQVADQTGGPPVGVLQQLGALQEVGVLQTAGASINRLQIDQEIKQLSETAAPGITQDQDAYQVVAAPFNALGAAAPTVPSGAAQQFALVRADNSSQIVQKQIQQAKGGATQKQNDGVYAPPPPFGGAPEDCHDMPAISPEAPNACVNFEQTAANGTNHQGQLSQTVDMEETTSVVGATQTQHPAKFTGGVDARVHQVITGMSGSSQNQANQSEKLRMFAPPGATQNQHGGAGCCGFGSQHGGVGNSEEINLDKDLDAVGGTVQTVQTATLVGTSSSPTGTCAIGAAASTNDGEASRSVSEDDCIALAVAVNCTENECQETDVAVCEPGEEPDVFVGEGGDISVACEGEGDPTITILGETDPAPLNSGRSP